ncbi:MAG: NuoM family protein [Acidobacteriota bacterium]
MDALNLLDRLLPGLLLGVPGLGSVVTAALGRSKLRARAAALGFAVVNFLLSLVVWARFDPSRGDYQLILSHEWIPSLGVSFLLGVDGISLFLVVMTALLVPVTFVALWKSPQMESASYLALLLLLEASLLGVFLALDLFLFFAFWVTTVVVMALLIESGRSERPTPVGSRFTLSTTAGSMLMLVVLLVGYHTQWVQTGAPSFDLRHWQDLVLFPDAEGRLFVALLLALAIHVPLFPLLGCLPEAQAKTPTAATVLLVGVFLKMGPYAVLRLALPLFPRVAETWAPAIMILAVLGILCGALRAWKESDLRKVLAGSSVSHMSLVILGVFSLQTSGVRGAVFHMLSHGLFMSMLLIMAGAVHEDAASDRTVELGGLRRAMPRLAAVFPAAAAASVGMPGLNGFIGFFLVLKGSLVASPWIAVAALLAILLAAASMLRLNIRMMGSEPLRGDHPQPTDLDRRETLVLVSLVLVLLAMGIVPGIWLGAMDGSVEKLLAPFTAGAG